MSSHRDPGGRRAVARVTGREVLVRAAMAGIGIVVVGLQGWVVAAGTVVPWPVLVWWIGNAVIVGGILFWAAGGIDAWLRQQATPAREERTGERAQARPAFHQTDVAFVSHSVHRDGPGRAMPRDWLGGTRERVR